MPRQPFGSERTTYWSNIGQSVRATYGQSIKSATVWQKEHARLLNKVLLLIICSSLLPVLAGCSEESKTIEGYLLEYYTVPEYTHPLGRVVERSGEEHIVALFCEDVNAALLGEDDEKVKDQILNRTLTNIYIKISYGAEDKTIVLKFFLFSDLTSPKVSA